MSAPVSLRARVEQYMAERRKLGFALKSMETRLSSFTRYVAAARPSRSIEREPDGLLGSPGHCW